MKTFKVEAKRADKKFPVKSPEITRIIGAKILIGCKVLKVDVHNPECRLFIDLRKDRTYIYDETPSFLEGAFPCSVPPRSEAVSRGKTR